MNGKYLDPMVPAIAYQLANGARSVWVGSFESRWAELELRQEQAIARFDRDMAAICARLEGSTNG